MKKFQIRIELLSDLCVSDGSGYNSSIDTDICYDTYGLPYIPGKRLKGCLRECAIELCDWGKSIPIKQLFGDEGDAKAVLRVGNAYLEKYESMKQQIEEKLDCLMFHPQNVLNQFSYIRMQTSIDYDNGVADEGALRSMRVANKGLVFFADIMLLPEYEKDLRLCCAVLKNMGIARTRGLGEIKAELISATEKIPVFEHTPLCEDATYLEYTIHVEDSIICKSVAGGEASTLDYIEGSKIFGIIANGLKRDGKNVVAFLNEGELVCSNAYIGENNIRFTEVPSCYYSIKNIKDEYVDKIYNKPCDDNDLQLNVMKHTYVCSTKNGLVKKNVDIEERYHHRRPENKAIGRAVDNNTKSGFYSMSSISPRQEFCGFVCGTSGQIKQVYQYLSENREFFIGYSCNSEYGRIKICITKTGNHRIRHSVACKEFLVKLESPAILYNDNAFYSINIDDLKRELELELELEIEEEQIEGIDCYMKYVTLGGFNVTWKCRKPIIEAFDKGTVLHYKLKRETEIPLLEHCFIGERITEGYGEITVMPVDSKEGTARRPIIKSARKSMGTYTVEQGSLLEAIAEAALKSYTRTIAIYDAQEFKQSHNMKKYGAIVSNMISMCKECSDYKSLYESVLARFDKNNDIKIDKKKMAENILNLAKDKSGFLKEGFCRKYQLVWKNDANLNMVYLKELLLALKYIIRQEEK